VRIFDVFFTEEHYPTSPLVVICDVYPAHRTDAVGGMALTRDVDVVFIPPGCTDRLQPLDRRVFGVLKAYARQQWQGHNRKQFGPEQTRAEMAADLEDAWDAMWFGSFTGTRIAPTIDNCNAFRIVSAHGTCFHGT
jgi:hypothetical protein